MLKTIKKILCPVDVYDFQPETAEYAIMLAEALDAEITVLYVMEPLPPRFYGEGGAIPSSFDEEEAAKRKAEAKLDTIMTTYFGNISQDKGKVALGQAADQIGRIAEESSADMIVMASHGRSVLGRVIYGSVTNKLLANTKTPVLVIQPTKE